jgi:radical SAM protein with 4Fe4S-binding SPASM domain
VKAAAHPPTPSAAALAALWRENRRALADAHARASATPSGRPAHLKIELTNFCNLRCPFCPHERMRRPTGYMEPALFHRIIDEAAPALEFAYLHHLGESLFHPRLGELIGYGRSRGAALGLSTNATFLDERRGAALIDNGLDFLVVSLDAATAETYALMRPGGDFARTRAQVQRFLARAAGSPMKVVVQLIVTAANLAEVEPFAAEWRAAGAAVMIKEARDWAGQVSLGTGAPRSPAAACRLPWSELTILWDGTVVACANFFERDQPLGDLRHQTLDEIWNGPAATALRRAHLEGRFAQIPVCRSCSGHRFDYEDFVSVGQLAQRHRTYLEGGDLARAGLS